MAADGLHTLFAWFSPGYPVGAFAYSHGLEWEIAEGEVRDAGTLRLWIERVLDGGAGRSDAILLAEAYRRAGTGGEGLAELSELALALAPSRERALETRAMGRAFASVTGSVYGAASDPLAYPVAAGAAGAALGLPLETMLRLYLHAFAANLVSAAVRFLPLGQTDGQRVLAELFALVDKVAAEAAEADLDDIGSCVQGADIASMQHETLETRIFRS